jgi:hypothetical protein
MGIIVFLVIVWWVVSTVLIGAAEFSDLEREKQQRR